MKIRSANDVIDHYLRGGLVESLLFSDLLKQQYNLDRQPNLYFWRDQTGHELDCIIDEVHYPIPVEIKSGKTVTGDFFKGLKYWNTITDYPDGPRYLIYGGNEDQNWPQAKVLSWRSVGSLMSDL